jgi:hypothetical protein
VSRCSPSRGRRPGEVAALLGERTCPEYRVKLSSHHTAAELRDALAGNFTVWRSRLHLAPPVDWEDESLDPSTRSTLHQWVWSDVLLRAANAGDRQAYDHALALARDWIGAEPPPGRSLYPWEGKETGGRAPYLAFIARLGARRGWLPAADAGTLIDALRAHGDWLAADAHYSADSNHALWADVGLVTLSDQVAPFLGSAGSWRAHAVTRSTRTWPPSSTRGRGCSSSIPSATSSTCSRCCARRSRSSATPRWIRSSRAWPTPRAGCSSPTGLRAARGHEPGLGCRL